MIFVPFGGGCLHYWSHRLGPLVWPEFHLYDREAPPGTQRRLLAAEAVNARPGCKAVVTTKRSLENYLSPAAIQEALGLDIEFSDTDSVAEIAIRSYLSPICSAEELSRRAVRRLRNRIKKRLNTDAVDRMTFKRLMERDEADELRTWLWALVSLAKVQ